MPNGYEATPAQLGNVPNNDYDYRSYQYVGGSTRLVLLFAAIVVIAVAIVLTSWIASSLIA